MQFHLPNFVRRRKLLEVVEFVPVRKAFQPMVRIRILARGGITGDGSVSNGNDLSGWVGDEKTSRKRWAMPAGSIQIIDEKKAREFVAKGYAEFVEPHKHQPISDDERAEHMASVTRIGL